MLATGYSAQNGGLVDAHGNPLQLRGVNWFGFETETHAPHGLWARSWRDMLDQIESIGANAIRVPVCPDTIHGTATRGIDPALNSDLVDLDSAALLDRLIQAMSDRGLYVLLDHHRPDCQQISELWHSPGYSEQDWINDLETLARRFRDVPGVLGIDLKNEPHGAATWGAGEPRTDWNHAAERAGAAVLRIAPRWLLFVEGIADAGPCSTGTGPAFWGENLEPMACTPLDLPPDRLVLAPHTYGPDVHPQPYFDDPRFPANMPAIWERRFGQFVDQGYTVLLGEFGGRYGDGDPRDRAWQDALIHYLISKGVRSGFYWSWNPNSDDTGGLLQDDWHSLQSEKVALLRRLWFAEDHPGVTDTDTPLTEARIATPPGPDAAPPTPRDVTPRLPNPPSSDEQALTTRIDRLSTWAQGLCEQITVRNTGDQPLRWEVVEALPGRITQLWNAHSAPRGALTQFRGLAWNATLPPDTSAHFGYCLDRSNTHRPPRTQDDADNNTDGIALQLNVQSDWGQGYCVQAQVRNTGAHMRPWVVDVPIEGQLRELWNAQYSRSGDQLQVRGLAHNAQLQPGAQTEFGFCALRRPDAG